LLQFLKDGLFIGVFN